MSKNINTEIVFTKAEVRRSGVFIFVVFASAAFGGLLVDFITNDFWQENFEYGLVFLTIVLCILYLHMIGISRWAGKLCQTPSGFLKLLFFILFLLIASCLVSFPIVLKTLPSLYTKLLGQPTELVLAAKKHIFKTNKGYQAFLYFENNEELRIQSNHNKYPDTEFKAKLIGKQSKLGFLVQSIEVVEQP
ncbi:hypothetical protein BKE30_00825 [Alkanindiges hydrocarboniclasticus]|uniref:Uncharacterized protein n=1 Tax=Alkanindiges hydrocarboniclasticus TaxID=1907941 RepID=A0A1S8CXM3_9GAMM|nr:hypothetical protein [Alkanindiges hydrocarboniclasticus]ONG42081.1 hypothetical protein BKE30_00825 [Alkanindiges hydrocarboniclasticus]